MLCSVCECLAEEQCLKHIVPLVKVSLIHLTTCYTACVCSTLFICYMHKNCLQPYVSLMFLMFPMKSHNLLTMLFIYSQCCVDYRSYRHHSITSLSQSHSLQVLELEFILLRMLLPNAHSHEVLCSRECVTSLCSCLRRKPSMKIVGHILDILSVILEEDRR